MPTGVALALPSGYAAFVHPRSGLAARHGVTIVNAPGTVDAGYRGEILVNLVNLDPSEPFTVRRGDRIAQLVVQQVERVSFLEVDSLDGHHRGDTGHGASGGFGPTTGPLTTHSTTTEGLSRTVSIFRRANKNAADAVAGVRGHRGPARTDPTGRRHGRCRRRRRRSPRGRPEPRRRSVRRLRGGRRDEGRLDLGALRHRRRRRHGAAAGGRPGGPAGGRRHRRHRRLGRAAAGVRRAAHRGHLGRTSAPRSPQSIVRQGGTAEEVRRPARHRAAHPDARPDPTAAPSSPRPASSASTGRAGSCARSSPAVRRSTRRRPAAASTVVRDTVVVRGDDAMAAARDCCPCGCRRPASDLPRPPRTPTPERSTDDLSPFERGPEITEVR